MNETLYFILDKRNLKNNFKKKIDLFTLNEFVLSESEKKIFNNIYPDPRQTSSKAEKLIIKTKETKLKIIKKIKNLYLFKELKDFDELIDPLLEIKISRFYYLHDVIPNYKKYILILRNKERIFNCKFELILAIDSLYCDDKISSNDFLKKFYKFKFNFYNGILLKIQKFLIINILKSCKKDIYFISAKSAYFIKNLKSKIKNKKNILLYYSSTNSFPKIILLLLKQLYRYLFRKSLNEIGIFLLPENKFDFNYKKISEYSKTFYLEELKTKYSKYLLMQLYSYALNTNSFQKYLIKLFKSIKIKNAYFHTIRFPDLFSFSRAILHHKNSVNLISHGTHTYQNNGKANKIASENLGIGLCFSKEKGISLISQSIYCDEFLDSLNLNYKKINRLINNNFSLSKNISLSKTNNKIKILYIGTVKQLGERRYYFESSAEFLESINDLYNKLKMYKSIFEITVRIRDVRYEIDFNILNNSIKSKKDLIKISNVKSIYEEIQNCDCLISFSSTTLEEGLIMNKPVMCFGLPGYNHLKLYENKPEQSNNKFLDKNLKIIEKALGRKFIYNCGKERKIDYEFM